ncbi:MAG: NAD(P)-dependent oxidoreductase [Deltaproteobacteria bacterium]|nr:NAD(P)-dependent oxidoreductase [Deltaproteobacteria bacterium]
MGNRILVNGAAGFLGTTVVELLCKSGYKVRATDRPGTSLDHARDCGAETVFHDLLETKGLDEIHGGVDAVVNVAGYFSLSADYDTLFDANVRCTENMCEASLKAGVGRFVHISSIGVYGLPVNYRAAEHSMKRPRNDYEITKKLGEDVALHYFREKGLPVTVLRPALIYGPRGRYGQAPMIAALALLKHLEFKRLYLYEGGPQMHHVHVQDVARAVELLLNKDEAVGEVFNCGDDTPVDWGLWLQWVAQHLGITYKMIPWYDGLAKLIFGALVRIPRRPVDIFNEWCGNKWEKAVKELLLQPMLVPGIDPGFFPYLAGHHVYDTRKIKALGFEPAFPYTRYGLKNVISWYKDNHWIP